MRILETDRLYLRELTTNDKEQLKKVLSDRQSMQFYPHPFSDEEVEKWIAWNINNYRQYRHGLWAVILKDGDIFLGDCGITMQNIDGETVPEIGFHIIGQYCNLGYATEAAIACKEYAFNTLSYNRVFSYTSTRNLPSQRVAQKMGMKLYKKFLKNDDNQVAFVSTRAKRNTAIQK